MSHEILGANAENDSSRNKETSIESMKRSLAEYREKIYNFLADFFSQQRLTALQIDPAILETIDVLSEFVLRGGKAISPYLAKLAYEIAGGDEDSEQFLSIGGALELHHKYLLLLDDLADRDEKRYGGATLEYVYRQKLAGSDDLEHISRSLAMFDGSLLISLSKQLLLQSPFSAESLIECHDVIHQHMSFETLAGWKIHFYQNEESIESSSIDQFTKGLELVTAKYKFLGPFEVGLILAGNKSETIRVALTTYANNVGTAFQVYDDILGMFGETKSTGKPVGNDVREGKKTLLLQVAYQRANVEEKHFLESVIGTPLSQADFERVQAIVISTGALDHSRKMAELYVEQGINALECLPYSTQKNQLIALAQYIISRDK